MAQADTGSVVTAACQSCRSLDLESVLWLGLHAPVNDFRPIGAPATEQPTHPLELFMCRRCELVQLGYVPDQTVTFPSDYPYRSGSTKALRDNFAGLARWVRGTVDLKPSDLVVDIGSNDGTLLSHFAPHCQCRGITPEDAATEANARGIRTVQRYFSKALVDELLSLTREDYAYAPAPLPGPAAVITCANCFAHVPNPHDFLNGVTALLAPGGIFVTESHYLHSLLDSLQYDAIYSEHARFYSLTSISSLLQPHGLEVFRVQRISTHGGSIRVWACRKDERPIEPEVATLAFWETHRRITPTRFRDFAARMKAQRAELWRAIGGRTVAGIGAPSRASTLVQFCGLDELVMPVVFETPGSPKIGKYMPGSRISVVEEPSDLSTLTAPDGTPIDALLLLSHHIADELIPKLRDKGFRGEFIKPLPSVEFIHA